MASKPLKWNGVILLVGLLGLLLLVSPAAGKRRASSPPPLHILQVKTTPSPFDITNGDLEICISVAVPPALPRTSILEVTSLIAYPTKRSMRFLSQRTPVSVLTDSQRMNQIDTTLVWDGTDQYNEKVSPGTYHYEVRAKLLKLHGNDLLTLWVSQRTRGIVEVIRSEAVQDDSVTPMPEKPVHETNLAPHYEEEPGTDVEAGQKENMAGVEEKSPSPGAHGQGAENPTGQAMAPQED